MKSTARAGHFAHAVLTSRTPIEFPDNVGLGSTASASQPFRLHEAALDFGPLLLTAGAETTSPRSLIQAVASTAPASSAVKGTHAHASTIDQEDMHHAGPAQLRRSAFVFCDGDTDPIAFGPLTQSRVEVLTRIFHMYDFNGDGLLDFRDMQILGWGISGMCKLPTPEEAAFQLQRADADDDGFLGLEEFLEYSTNLAFMPNYLFADLRELLVQAHHTAVMTGLQARVQGS